MGRATGDRNSLGYWSRYALDSMGRAVTVTNALGGVSRNVFDLAGEVTSSRNPLGYWQRYVYNGRGWLQTLTDPRNQPWTYQWDAAGNLQGVLDPALHGPTVGYDALNRPADYNDGDGNHTLTTYWEDNTVKQIQDPYGVNTQFSVDYTTKTILETDAAGTANQLVTKSLFDNTGMVTDVYVGATATTATRLLEKLQYDVLDRVYIVKDGLLHATTLGYDKESNVTSVTDALNKTTTLAWDALERNTSATDPNANTTKTLLDAMDQQVGYLDGLNKLWQTRYDGLGDPYLSIDPMGGKIVDEFNVAGWLLSVTDPVGNKTTYDRNPMGMVTKETDPFGKSNVFTYTNAGQLDTLTDKLGKVQDYGYYNSGLLQNVVYQDSAGGPIVNTKSFTYNANQLLATATDSNSSYAFTYDELSREKTQLDQNNLTLTYNYDPSTGLLDTVSDSAGGLRDYDWDAANRLTSLKYSEPGGNPLAQLREDFVYDDRSEVTQVKRYTDTAGTTLVGKSLYGYDDGGRTTSITHQDALGSTLDSFSYQYDAADRISVETTSQDGTKNYTYDNNDQLTGDGTRTYGWDANGNSTNSGFVTTTNNELQTDGTWTYAYNDEGNLTSKVNNATTETWTYFYNGDNQLVKAEHKMLSGGLVDQRIEFKYDVFGQRIEKSVDADGDGPAVALVTKFAYENGNAWADLVGGSLTNRRIYSGLDGLAARIGSSGAEDWYLTDLHGSVTDLVNTAGAPIDHLAYDPFGKILSESNSAVGDRYKWTSREFDAETGLQYNRARYYDPNTMRWTSQDPLGFDAGDSNLYRYTSNSPNNHTDPSGEIVPLVLLGMAGAALFLGPQVANAPSKYDRTSGKNEFGLALFPSIQVVTAGKLPTSRPVQLAVFGGYTLETANDYADYFEAYRKGKHAKLHPWRNLENSLYYGPLGPANPKALGFLGMGFGAQSFQEDFNKGKYERAGVDLLVFSGSVKVTDKQFSGKFQRQQLLEESVNELVRREVSGASQFIGPRPRGLDGVVFDANAAPVAERASIVRTALQARVTPAWTFREAVGTDGTRVFYGEVNEAIIIRPSGTVVRGTVPSELRTRLLPTPRNSNPNPPFTIDDLTID